MTLLEREAELAALQAALDEAAAARGGVVVVTGEAGIGKSALLAHFLAGLDGSTRALVGACDDLSIPRPLAPFRDLAGSVAPALAAAISSGAHPHELYPLLLEELDGPRPTVLVLEDVHWADSATLDAATFLARRLSSLRALLVLTVREGEAPPRESLDATLGAAAGAHARFVQLGPLSEEAVASLAAGAAADVYAATGGNPFLVTELLCGGDETLPATVANAVLGRVARLDARSRALVDLVSVVPGRVTPELLDVALPGWADAAEEPERRRLLEVGPHHLRFRHELVRQAVLSGLPAAAVRTLHGRVLDALLAAEGDPAEIVHHAEAAGREQTVAEHVLRAARRAAGLASTREAHAHYRRALDFVELLEVPERAAVYEEHADAAYRARHNDEALHGLGLAIRLNRTLGDEAAVGRCLRSLAQVLWCAGLGEPARASAREAIAVLEPLGPSGVLAGAYSGLARLELLRPEIDEAETWGTRALELADRVDHAETRVHALVTLASRRLLVDPEAGAELRAAHDAAHEAGDREEATRALAALAAGLTSWVRADAASEAARAAVAYADRHEVQHMAPFGALAQAALDLRAGRWAEAERTARAHLRSKVGLHVMLAETVLTELAVRRGDRDAEARLAALAARAEDTRELQRLGPVLELSIERALFAGAEPPAGRVLPYLTDRPAPHAVDVLRLGAWAAAAGIPVRLEAPAGTPWEPMLRRDWPAAAAAFGAAGWGYDRAVMLVLEGDEASLVEAIGVAHALGAEPLAQSAARRLRELGARVPRGPRRTTRANRAGLTGRQLEVLALLVEDLTNAEIADRLVVSTRTVEHHVAAVLQKLGAATRRDAARRATELEALRPAC